MKLATSTLLFAALLVAGCAKPHDHGSQTKDTKVAKKVDDHSGWWCAPHGIPEHECSMCNTKVAKAFKDQGDWCKEHPDRAASQCFICNPKQMEFYAAKYRAKYGEEPPPPEDNMPKDAPKKEDSSEAK